jgi:hypothetical protein
LNNLKIDKMENRIQVNGEWYVKESTIDAQPIELDLNYFESCICDTEKYRFEATRTYKDYDQNEFYSDTIDIKFTDKRTQPWKTENWDNVSWFRKVFDDDRTSVNEALEVMDIDGIIELKALVLNLIEKGWIMYFNCENINIGKNKSGKDRRIPGAGC